MAPSTGRWQRLDVERERRPVACAGLLRRFDKPELNRLGNRVRPVDGIELGRRTAKVNLHGLAGDTQDGGNIVK